MTLINDIIEFFSKYFICCTDITMVQNVEKMEDEEGADLPEFEEYYFVEA